MRIGPKINFSLKNFDSEIQDGVKIQNGAKNRKKLVFAAKWPNSNGFQKSLLCFVCPTSVHKKPFSWKF